MAEIQDKEETIKIQDFIPIIISKWYWFVICVVVFLLIGTTYLKTASPVYTRTASIVIKDDSKGPSMGGGNSMLGDLDLFKSNVNINNELLTLQAPSLMIQVINNLDLNEIYKVRSGLRTLDLYKRSPVCLTFASVVGKKTFTCDLRIEDENRLIIHHFKYYDTNASKIVLPDLQSTFGDTIHSRYGDLVINKTSFFDLKTYKRKSIKFSYINPLEEAIQLEKHLNIALGNKEATYVNFRITDVSTQRAEDILNTLISVYNNNWVSNKNQVSIASNRFIDARLVSLENELNGVDTNIAKFKSKNLLPDVQAVSKLYMDQYGQTKTDILTLTNQISIVQYIKEYLEKNSHPNLLLPANVGVENEGIEKQIGDYNTLVLQYNSLLANSSMANPVVQDLKRSIESTRKMISKSVDNNIITLRKELAGVNHVEEQTSDQIANTPNQAKYLLSVEREQKVKEALYLFLLQKREENQLSQAFTAYNTQIVNPPIGLDEPTSPKKSSTLFIAIILGLLIPGIILFLKETLSMTVRGRKDVGILTLPFVGEIPLFTNGKKSKCWLCKLLKKKRNKIPSSDIVVQEGSRNYINEAFRVVRTNLDFMQGGTHGKQIMMFTSFNPGSGKTFVSINLAMTSALRGKKVIILDLDLRKAALTQSLDPGKKQKIGLSHFLSGQTDDCEKIIVKSKEHPNFDYVTAGMLPPNPSELLLTDRLACLLDKLREQYDFVFLDCPPINLVADATIITRLSDMTLFIVRVGNLDRRMLPVLDELYKTNKLKNMSLILNGVSNSSKGYGYGYGYGYGN